MLLVTLLPLILCLLWFAYLQYNGWTLAQGMQGFMYILGFSSVLAVFLTAMLFLTN